MILLITSVIMPAQVPEGFNFQAVIRNNRGDLASNQVVNVKVSILNGLDGSNVIFSENHSVRTNSQGLITCVIGNGSNQSSEFSAIEWNNGPFFIQVEADVNGGMDYQLVSKTQILAVPYAIHSQSAENLSGTVSFNQVTDVPDNFGFSGDYNDLINRPEIFSGDYNDLINTPNLSELFSGDYNDLRNRPVLKDSVEKYGFSGNYNDLKNVPRLFSGSYNDLTDLPTITENGFTGVYSDLSGKPNFFVDSLPVWNSQLDYTKLKNLPNLSADGSFSGSYYDLINLPDIPGIATQVVNAEMSKLEYANLKKLPNFSDSVEYYSNRVDYNRMVNTPNIKDSVEKYAPTIEGSTIVGTTDYNDLTNRPNIKDSVAQYSFSGNYNDLTNRPSIKDSIEANSFSGRWEDLKGMPTGSQTGDILYWNNDLKGWFPLSKGNAGDVLVATEDGVPSWVNVAFLWKNVEQTKFVPVKIKNYPISNVTITDEYGLLSDSGTIDYPQYFDAVFVITPDLGYGIKKVMLNDSVVEVFVENGAGYLEFTVTEEQYDITIELGSYQLVAKHIFYDADTVQSVVNDTLSVGFGAGYCMPIISNEDFAVEKVLLKGVDITDSVLGATQICLGEVVEDTEIEIHYRKGLFSVGDIYEENGIAIGIIYDVFNNGKSAKIISIESLLYTQKYQWAAANAEVIKYPGWSLPSADEMKNIYEHLGMIENILQSQGKEISNESMVWSSSEYNAQFAYMFNLHEGYSMGIEKTNEGKILLIKTISK
jgi:hypothetical protein